MGTTPSSFPSNDSLQQDFPAWWVRTHLALILQSLIHLVHFNGNSRSTSSQAHMKVFKTLRSGPERHKKPKAEAAFSFWALSSAQQSKGWGGMGWDGVGMGMCCSPRGGWGHFQETLEFNLISSTWTTTNMATRATSRLWHLPCPGFPKNPSGRRQQDPPSHPHFN